MPQQAWIQNMTLRDNILFGKPYVKDSYERVLRDCCLMDDLKILSGGDKTEIGERVKRWLRCKTAVSPLLMHRRYSSLAPTHRNDEHIKARTNMPIVLQVAFYVHSANENVRISTKILLIVFTNMSLRG